MIKEEMWARHENAELEIESLEIIGANVPLTNRKKAPGNFFKREYLQKKALVENADKIYDKSMESYLRTGKKHFLKRAKSVEKYVEQSKIDLYRDRPILPRLRKDERNRTRNHSDKPPGTPYFI